MYIEVEGHNAKGWSGRSRGGYEMKNAKTGLYSAILAGISTAIFAVSMLKESMSLISFGICMVLSWSYTILTCAFAAEADEEHKAFAYAGLSFACLYAVFIQLVYFTQLTTVNQAAASEEVIHALTYTPGSWMFALDLLGYAVMAVSTFFVGLTIQPISRTDRWLKAMLKLHGLFAICLVMPMLSPFDNAGNDSLDQVGVIVLEIWCLYFIPMMVLAAKHFNESGKSVQNSDKGL